MARKKARDKLLESSEHRKAYTVISVILFLFALYFVWAGASMFFSAGEWLPFVKGLVIFGIGIFAFYKAWE